MFSYIHVGARDSITLVAIYKAQFVKLGFEQMPEDNGPQAKGGGWKYPDKR